MITTLVGIFKFSKEIHYYSRDERTYADSIIIITIHVFIIIIVLHLSAGPLFSNLYDSVSLFLIIKLYSTESIKVCETCILKSIY